MQLKNLIPYSSIIMQRGRLIGGLVHNRKIAPKDTCSSKTNMQVLWFNAGKKCCEILYPQVHNVSSTPIGYQLKQNHLIILMNGLASNSLYYWCLNKVNTNPLTQHWDSQHQQPRADLQGWGKQNKKGRKQIETEGHNWLLSEGLHLFQQLSCKPCCK